MKNQVAIVTGGSRGIGQAIVRRFAKDGAKVYFTYQASSDEAKRLEEEFKSTGNVFAYACDVRDKDQIQKFVETVLDKESTLDILVNNAGIIRDELFLTMSDQNWQDVLDTNLGGTFYFTKAVLRQMFSQRSGRIINISSIVGELGGVGQANYSASKGAINSLTRSVATEVASRGITVNAIAPGMVETQMSEAVRSAFGQQIKEKIPMGSFAQPDEIAAVAAFLASSQSRYITGQVITIDGGLSLLSRR